MNEMDKEDLKKAYRSEKDPKIRARILAVHIVSVYEESIGQDGDKSHAVRKMGARLTQTV